MSWLRPTRRVVRHPRRGRRRRDRAGPRHPRRLAAGAARSRRARHPRVRRPPGGAAPGRGRPRVRAPGGAGPLGESPRVDTAWYGLGRCAGLAFDGHGRLVGVCGDRKGPVLQVIDPGSMRPLVTKDLPDRPEGDGTAAWEELCGRASYLDDEDRAVVATTDRRVLVVATDDAEGDPDLTTAASHDLAGQVPADDCLVALRPGRARRPLVRHPARPGRHDRRGHRPGHRARPRRGHRQPARRRRRRRVRRDDRGALPAGARRGAARR